MFRHHTSMELTYILIIVRVLSKEEDISMTWLLPARSRLHRTFSSSIQSLKREATHPPKKFLSEKYLNFHCIAALSRIIQHLDRYELTVSLQTDKSKWSESVYVSAIPVFLCSTSVRYRVFSCYTISEQNPCLITHSSTVKELGLLQFTYYFLDLLFHTL